LLEHAYDHDQAILTIRGVARPNLPLVSVSPAPPSPRPQPN
jgi:hypothetical protein